MKLRNSAGVYYFQKKKYLAVDPLDAPRLSGGTPSTAPTPAGGKTLFTFTSPETLTVT